MGESKKFMLVVVLSFFLFLVGISLAYLAFALKVAGDSADTSISQYKDLVREEADKQLRDFSIMLRDPDINALLVEGSEGDSRKLAVSIFSMLEASFGEPYYLCLIQGEKVVVSKLPAETGKDVPEDLLAEGSRYIGDFRGKRGELLMLASPVDEKTRAVVVLDKTKEVAEARQPFEDQKSRLGWISLILFFTFLAAAVALALFAVGWANNRYISRPIRDLQGKAKRMMEGETEVALTVDEDSDYYALQALLDSMQRLLREAESRGSGPES